MVASCKSTLGPVHNSAPKANRFPIADNHQPTKNYINEKGETVWEFALPSTPFPKQCSPTSGLSSSQGSHPCLLEVPAVESPTTAEVIDIPQAEVPGLLPGAKPPSLESVEALMDSMTINIPKSDNKPTKVWICKSCGKCYAF